MIDKQIIIDGVDVSGCVASHFNFDGCFYECKIKGFHNNCFYIDCEDNPNCNYKQLKRKEQECEALRMSENEAGEIIDELKAENDTLRQFLSKEPLSLQALQSAYSSYKKSADVFYEMVEQYKQTLAEIKEICNKKSGWVNCSNNMPTETAIFAQQILQKISEVNNENRKMYKL